MTPPLIKAIEVKVGEGVPYWGPALLMRNGRFVRELPVAQLLLLRDRIEVIYERVQVDEPGVYSGITPGAARAQTDDVTFTAADVATKATYNVSLVLHIEDVEKR